MKPPPKGVTVPWAWERVLAILGEQHKLTADGDPQHYGTAMNIYKRIVKRHAPDAHERERVDELLAEVRQSAVPADVLIGFNRHSRSKLLSLDVGGWYLTRAGLCTHAREPEFVTMFLRFDTPFMTIYPRESATSATYLSTQPGQPIDDVPVEIAPLKTAVRPLFCWTVQAVKSYVNTPSEPAGPQSTEYTKITPEIASWLARGCDEAPAWMSEQMERSLDLIDAAVQDVDLERPTVGGCAVPQSVLDHRATKELMRLTRAAIEGAIHQIRR